MSEWGGGSPNLHLSKNSKHRNKFEVIVSDIISPPKNMLSKASMKMSFSDVVNNGGV